jgi:hypothetical protein
MHVPERTSRFTQTAPDTQVFVDFDCPGVWIALESLRRASLDAGGIHALQARYLDVTIRADRVYAYSGMSKQTCSRVGKGASHFTGAATDTFTRQDHQGLAGLFGS